MQFQLAYMASLSRITSVEIMTALLFQFLKGKIVHHLFNLMSFQICMTYFLLQSTKADILKNATNICCILEVIYILNHISINK